MVSNEAQLYQPVLFRLSNNKTPPWYLPQSILVQIYKQHFYLPDLEYGRMLNPDRDPPLLMGFMRGVPFFWSLHLFPILIFNMVILLTVFYLLDRHNYRKDIANGRNRISAKPVPH